MINGLYNNSDVEIIEKFGLKIKELRVQKNISQRELAEKVGMSRSSISEIEKGRNFSIASLISIARTLDFLEKFEFFLLEEKVELSPMELYEKQQKKRKRGGYKK